MVTDEQLRALAQKWRKKAEELEAFGSDGAAMRVDECADDLEALIPCDCPCHSDPNVFHAFPCCARTYQQFSPIDAPDADEFTSQLAKEVARMAEALRKITPTSDEIIRSGKALSEAAEHLGLLPKAPARRRPPSAPE